MLRAVGRAVCARVSGASASAWASAARGGVAVRTQWCSLALRDKVDVQRVVRGTVRVTATVTKPDYIQPWHRKSSFPVTGTGFVVSGKRLLTNAHVVDGASYVSVQRQDQTRPYRAHVVSMAHDCDLALLELAEDSQQFFEGGVELELGELPRLQDSVVVVGFPLSGDTASVTSGVVSRIEQQQYSHGMTVLLAVQIDAAINPGNSGGPVMMDDKVVGMAFQNLSQADNMGFIIPSVVIERFLRGVSERGKRHGMCSLGMTTQNTHNKVLRAEYRVPNNLTGVLVNRVFKTGPAALAGVRVGDVLCSVDGVPIANDGTIPLREHERTLLDYVLLNKYPGDVVKCEVLRQGERITLDLPLQSIDALTLVPVHDPRRTPSYFVVGGLVFTRLVQPYLHAWGSNWVSTAPRNLVELALMGTKRFISEDVAVLSHVLAHASTTGYHHIGHRRVLRVNGRRVSNLRHLFQEVRAINTGSVTFQLDSFEQVTISVEDARRREASILQTYAVPAAVSADLATTQSRSASATGGGADSHGPAGAAVPNADQLSDSE